MRAKFAAYNLELQEVLIGTPRAAAGDEQIEKILQQLRARQIAEERVATYDKQRMAAGKRRRRCAKPRRAPSSRPRSPNPNSRSRCRKTRARPHSNARPRKPSRRARSPSAESDRIRNIGEGEAAKVVALAGAEAERITQTGLATAETIEKQADASAAAQFQLTRQVVERLAEALEKSGVDIVPRVQINSGTDGGAAGGSVLQALLGMLVSEKGLAMIAEPSAANDKTGRPITHPGIAAE